jgi:hypothetical protein
MQHETEQSIEQLRNAVTDLFELAKRIEGRGARLGEVLETLASRVREMDAVVARTCDVMKQKYAELALRVRALEGGMSVPAGGL